MSTSPSSPIETEGLASSPVAPIRYFDILPLELVTEIHGWVDEEDFDRVREKTLVSLCLTAKRFLQEARSLLLGDITILRTRPGSRSLAKLVETVDDNKLALVRRLHLGWSNLTNSASEDLTELADAVVNLSELWIDFAEECLLPSRGANLTILSLYSLYLNNVDLLSFPHLTHLHLSDVHRSGDLVLQVPSLKHLTTASGHFRLQFLDQLPPRLASCSYDASSRVSLPASILESPSIFRCYKIWDKWTLPAKHVHVLRLRCPNRLTDCIESFKNSDPSVEAVILPLPKKGSQTDLWAPLLDTCSRRQIQVVWATAKHDRSLFDDAAHWVFREAERRHLGNREGGGGQGREFGSHRHVG
ncbi:hypothetical protein JCM3766R1_004795 [Sporobolomyces carnicolor]